MLEVYGKINKYQAFWGGFSGQLVSLTTRKPSLFLTTKKKKEM